MVKNHTSLIYFCITTICTILTIALAPFKFRWEHGEPICHVSLMNALLLAKTIVVTDLPWY